MSVVNPKDGAVVDAPKPTAQKAMQVTLKSKALSTRLSRKWYIREVIVERKTPKNNKRTLESMLSEKMVSAAATTKKRKLSKAAEGTIKITNFFK